MRSVRMRVPIRWGAAGKICTALLLGVVPIALVIPCGHVAFSQGGTGSRHPLYMTIDLHPSGFISSEALGVSGGQQVGVGTTEGDKDHALLWRSSAASVVDLLPSRGIKATATCGGQQVGYGGGFSGGGRHALLWRGSAASVMDLHPSGFTDSEAHSTSGRVQVGSGIPPGGGSHALLWRGSTASAVDLHPSGFDGSEADGTSGGEQVGFGWGPATKGSSHALLWRGSAASAVDLHPRGFDASEALGTSGREQVGWGTIVASDLPGMMADHALLWRGNAASVVDLNPPGFVSSEAFGINGEEQVGWGDSATSTSGYNRHALLWHGSTGSVVDLHTFLPPGFVNSVALSIDAAGDIVGAASTGRDIPSHAILWRRNVPRPGTSRAQSMTGC